MESIKPIADLRRWFHNFFEKKTELKTTERCCISISAKDISLLHIDQIQEGSKVLFADTLSYTDEASLLILLRELVSAHKLQNIPCSLLLTPDDYHFFVIEALPVEKNEFKNALNWRIRSLINYPIEEAVLDYFPIPAKKAAPDSPMTAVVVAKESLLSYYIRIIKKAGMNLSVIDVPELALRNLAAQYETDEKGTAFLYFYKNFVIFNITFKQTLFFNRRINWAPQPDNAAASFEQLGLEVLRYFDYFQTQWRHPSPRRIFIATTSNDPATMALLSKYLLIQVEPYIIKSLITDDVMRELVQQKYLLLFGSSLRKEDEHATPEH